MKQDFSQFKELPAPLPAGERVIWQGKPSFKALALRSFHIREVAIYFGLLLIWRLSSNWSHGVSAGEAFTSALWLIVPAISGIGVLAGLAWLFQRAACYTITSKRILFQFGVALPMTMNIPLGKIANAALKTYRDGSGDIPLRLNDEGRVSYLLLWPHVRPWRLRVTEPMLNSIPDAAKVAAKLAEALTGKPGPSAISLVNFDEVSSSSNAIANSPPPLQPERRRIMSEAIHEPVVPKGGVLAGAALILFALAAVTTVRLTGVGGTHMTLPAAIESRDLRFEDGQHGAVLVFDANDQQLVDTLAPGSNGFIRVVMRGLARERKLGDIGAQPPFRLTRYAGGEITLTDMSSGKQIDLGAFGSTNTEAFASLMNLRSVK